MKKMTAYEYKIELFTNETALNKLGKEGWDLVCPGGKDGNYLVFKRPVGESSAQGHSGDGMSQMGSEKKQKPQKKSYKEFL